MAQRLTTEDLNLWFGLLNYFDHLKNGIVTWQQKPSQWSKSKGEKQMFRTQCLCLGWNQSQVFLKTPEICPRSKNRKKQTAYWACTKMPYFSYNRQKRDCWMSGAEMTPRSAQTNKQTPSSCCLSWGYGHLLFYPFLHVTKCKWLARWRPLRVSVALSVTQVTCRTSLSPAQEAIKQSTNSHTDTSPHDSAVLLRLYWDPSRSNNRNRTGSAFPAVLSGDFYHSEHFTLHYQNTVFPI